MRFEVKELNPYFGAEITGLRLHAETVRSWVSDLRQAFTDYGLLVLRGNEISMADQVALGQRFGDVQLHEMDQYRREDYPEIYFLTISMNLVIPVASIRTKARCIGTPMDPGAIAQGS